MEWFFRVNDFYEMMAAFRSKLNIERHIGLRKNLIDFFRSL